MARMNNPKFLRLAANLLDLASDTFSNHSCNDFKMHGFSGEELEALADLMNRQNLGSDYKTEYAPDDDDVNTSERLEDCACDFSLMSAMAFMLQEMADEAEKHATMQR